jgi:3-oxoacid CoA-transferase subunit B
MDLVAGAKRVIAVMEHTARDGRPKLVKACSYPLTGLRCVDTVFTDLAVLEVTDGHLMLTELAPGVTGADVQDRSDARLHISPNLREMEF